VCCEREITRRIRNYPLFSLAFAKKYGKIFTQPAHLLAAADADEINALHDGQRNTLISFDSVEHNSRFINSGCMTIEGMHLHYPRSGENKDKLHTKKHECEVIKSGQFIKEYRTSRNFLTEKSSLPSDEGLFQSRHFM
jgi:hypothetical protein